MNLCRIMLCVVLFFSVGCDREETHLTEGGDLVVDTITGGQVTHRSITQFAEDGSVLRSCAGPVSESGQPHGHWVDHQYQPRRVVHSWAWYGQEVTEAEFHSRDKTVQ